MLVEYYGCQRAILDDVQKVEELLARAAVSAGATVVKAVFHQFTPQGVSGVVVIEESHLSVHTWPETGYAAVDFYTCGDCFPERAHQVLIEGLSPEHAEIMLVERGLRGRRSMEIREHRLDQLRSSSRAGTSEQPPPQVSSRQPALRAEARQT